MRGEGLQFESAADFLSDAVFVLDPNGDIVWANRAAGNATGRSPEALSGQSFPRLLTPVSSEIAERALRILRGDAEPTTLLDLEILRPDLTSSRLEFELNPVSGALRTVIAVGRSMAHRDSLERKGRRAEFQSLQFQAALVELARSESKSLDDNLVQLTGVAASALDVACVGVWLFDNSHAEIRCVHRFDRERNEHRVGGEVLEVRRFPRHFDALEQARVIAAEDAVSDPLTAELAADYLVRRGTASILDVPIRWNGRTVGVLCHEHVGEPRHWRLDERNFAASLADLTALALETDRRRHAEVELRRSLDQLELFFSQSLDGFFFMMLDEPMSWDATIDKDDVLEYVFDHQRMVKCNDALLRQYRESPELLLGITPRRLYSHDVEHGKALWRRMLDAGRLHVESDERRADGSRMWVEGDYICFYDAEGCVTGHFGIQRDVTERKDAEETLRHYNRRLTLLQHIDRAILNARSVEEIADAALAVIPEIIPVKRATVVEFDLASRAARLVGIHPSSSAGPVPGSLIPIEVFGGLADLCQGRHRIVEAIPDVAVFSFLREQGIRSFVNVPLLAEGELIGALNLGSDKNDAFSASDLEVADEVANSLSVAIRHARLSEKIAMHAAELEQRVAERTDELTRANAHLRDSEERLAGIFQSAMDAILVTDANRNLVILNEAAERVFRCHEAQMKGGSIEALLTDDLSRFLQDYIASDGPAPRRAPEGLRAKRADGEPFAVEASVVRTQTSHGTLFSINLRDINEKKAAEERLEELEQQNVYLQDEIREELNFEEIVGASAMIQRVFASIEMVASTDSTVLLLGETGTGKELIARAVHNRSRRRQNAMIKVNCAALPPNLVESELFGHERGAFTGAISQKKGRFELANRGTIFLDEVGELPLEAQSRLLRVLQEEEFERVGGTQTQKVDVRVIAATNRELKEELKRGTFRADLYYRLNVFPIEVPPLRHRREDIPLLAAYFVRKFSDRMGKRIDGIHKEAIDQLRRYDWPGNVRELTNLVERAVILCQGNTLNGTHLSLPQFVAGAGSAQTLPTLEGAERDLILEALQRTNGVLAGPGGAAELLGINRSTLWSRIRKLGLDVPRSAAAR